MKKFLLLFLMSTLAGASLMAAGLTRDPNGYEGKNGINIRNLWLKDRIHYNTNLPNVADWCSTSARKAVLCNGIVYISRTGAKQVIPQPGDTIMAAVVYRINALTGEELAPLDITLNGEPYSGGTLGANNIGKDNFGHLWLAPYTSEKTATQLLYQLNPETGELTLLGSLDKGSNILRDDYIDLVGDITLEEAECNVMGANADGNFSTIYGWHNEQGGDADTWEGFFGGDPSYDITEFYPETVTAWSFAPVTRFVLGEGEDRYSGEYFYIDGFNTVPMLYFNDGSIVDGFGNLTQEEMDADSLLMPKVGTNGIAEFTLADRNFIAYSIGQYDAPNSCQINVCELGEGMAFNGMQRYWTLPADGLGQTSDSGTRIHAIDVEYTTEGGKDAVLLLTFKCYNGVGIYLIGEGVTPDDPIQTTVPGDVNGDGEVTGSDVTALYNHILFGQDTEIFNGDQNGDGEVTGSDVTAVYNIILGL